MIELKNCILKRKNFTLDIESFKIKDEEKIFLIGASGSGKTTLLKIVAGLESEYSGEYMIDKSKTLPKLNRRGVMFLSQDFALWEHMRASEHLNFMLNGGKSLKNHQESSLFLNYVGLSHKIDSYPHELSGGEKQRLALARVLSAKPKYLFLDEPFSSLDVVLADAMMQLIHDLQIKYKFALIKSTHQYFGIKDSDSLIVVLDNGKIIQKGDWNEISKRPNSEWIKRWVNLVR